MSRYIRSSLRVLMALAAVLLLAFAVAACGDDDDDDAPAGNGGAQQEEQASGGLECAQDGCSIGISVPEAQNPFYIAFSENMKKALEEQGHSVRMVSADSDVPEQIDGVNDLLAAGIDLLLISPIDEQGPVPAFRAAQREDVPVITYLRTLNDEDQAEYAEGFIGFFLEESGQLKGEWLVEHVEPGPIAMLLGPAGASFAVEQEQGFKSAIEGEGFEVVFEQTSGQSREEGVRLAEDALAAHPDLVAIYASNDDMALGAAQAVRRAGRTGDVAILGLNGAPPALEAVQAGQIAMTVALNPVAGAEKVVELTQQFIETGEIPEATPIEQTVVDEENVADFLEG